MVHLISVHFYKCKLYEKERENPFIDLQSVLLEEKGMRADNQISLIRETATPYSDI